MDDAKNDNLTFEEILSVSQEWFQTKKEKEGRTIFCFLNLLLYSIIFYSPSIHILPLT